MRPVGRSATDAVAAGLRPPETDAVTTADPRALPEVSVVVHSPFSSVVAKADAREPIVVARPTGMPCRGRYAPSRTVTATAAVDAPSAGRAQGVVARAAL